MEVAYGSPLPLEWESPLLQWLAVVGAVVFSSVHNQDMADQEGDKAHDQRTIVINAGLLGLCRKENKKLSREFSVYRYKDQILVHHQCTG